eukprot:6159505-Alexandrium_andersonii.AAC.1
MYGDVHDEESAGRHPQRGDSRPKRSEWRSYPLRKHHGHASAYVEDAEEPEPPSEADEDLDLD